MKQRINITIDESIHKKGVLLAKEETEKQDKYISFSSLVESLIIKEIEQEKRKK